MQLPTNPELSDPQPTVDPVSKKLWLWPGLVLVVAAQVALIWYVFMARKRTEQADARIFAQRQREFDRITNMQSLNVGTLEPISQPKPVLLRASYGTQSIGVTKYHDVMVHAVFLRSSGGDFECAMQLEGRTVAKSFDPILNTLALDIREVSDLALMKTGSRIFPGSNLEFKSSSTLTTDHQGRITNLAGILTIGGKLRDYPKLVAPLVFPGRELTVADKWSLVEEHKDGGKDKSRDEVTRAEARLTAFVKYETAPCARIDADVASVADPKSVFGGPISIPTLKDGEKVRTLERRIYLVRLADAEVVWSETISDIENLGKITTRVHLRQKD